LVVDYPPVADPLPPGPRLFRWTLARALLAAVLLTMAVTAGGLWLHRVHYARSYQPIGRGYDATTTPPVPARTTVKVTDGITSQTYALIGPTGSTGTVSYTLANTGPFDITLLPARPSDSGGLLKFRWSPEFVSLPDGSGSTPLARDARPLPVIWRAHHSLQLFVTATKPRCHPQDIRVVETLPLRWVALGVHHVTYVHLDPQDESLSPIALCTPRAALQRIASR
jgi:hypothetical protein